MMARPCRPRPRPRGGDAKTAAVLTLLRACGRVPERWIRANWRPTLRKLGRVTARLSAEEMLRLLARRDDESNDSEVVAAVLDHMDDEDVAHFVAASVVAERGATARLAHAFQALVPDTDRRRRLRRSRKRKPRLARWRATGLFDDLFGKVESHGQLLLGYQLRLGRLRAGSCGRPRPGPVDVEQAADDPPERVGAGFRQSTMRPSADWIINCCTTCSRSKRTRHAGGTSPTRPRRTPRTWSASATSTRPGSSPAP